MNKKEFEEKIKHDLPKLKNYLIKKTSDFDLAEEILQETLISASQSYFFFKENVYNWCYNYTWENQEMLVLRLIVIYANTNLKDIIFARFRKNWIENFSVMQNAD